MILKIIVVASFRGGMAENFVDELSSRRHHEAHATA